MRGKDIFFKQMKQLMVSGIFLIIFILVAVLPGFSTSLAPRYYKVKKGDYLIDLERKYGVSWKKIKEVNAITSNTIYQGQELRIPWEGIWHTVREGEYLNLIAKTYSEACEISQKIIMEEIIQANKITNLDNIKVGQKLFIPRAKEVLGIEIPEEKLPRAQEGVYHTIGKGQTLYRIALNYGQTQGITEKEMQKKIMEANNISDPTKLKVGDELFIPGAKKVLEIEIPLELVKKEDISMPTQAELVEEPPIFFWPVEGEIIEYFGEGGIEWIGIAAPEGEIVVAPAEGIVLERKFLQGYGETLLIEHEEEGLYTCYFHLLDYLVEKDAQVKKGEPIARVGMSGAVDIPCLRFQVRKIGSEDKTVNPLDYLP